MCSGLTSVRGKRYFWHLMGSVGSGFCIPETRVPKHHRDTVFDLTTEEWEATFALLQRARELLDREYSPQGYNVGWNCGQVGGQEVFHAHLHVIPRYADEPFAGRGIRYWLKQDDNKRGATQAGRTPYP